LSMNSLETTDIFRGAFYLCMGSDLAEIRINNRQIASFMFAGPDLAKHDKAYVKGHALVNPVQFRQALNHLRDILFTRLRRYENDRTNQDRSDQNRH